MSARAASPRAVLLLLLALVAGAPAVPAAPVNLPPRTRATLKNGLTVIILPTTRLPLVDMRLAVTAGSVNDPRGKEGLADLTASLLTQGAGGKSAQQIAEEIAFVGGTLDADAGAEQIVVTTEVLSRDFRTGLSLLHDVVVHPAFPAEEFARKQSEALAQIASERDDPSSIANNMLGPFLLGGSPLAHPVIGWEQSVKALRRADVVEFHRRYIRPENAILAIVGDVEPRRTLAALERAFADWKRAGAPLEASYAQPTAAKGHAVLVVNKPEVTQTQIRLATIGVPRNHPDYFPLLLGNTILGSGFTSRLINELRVTRGLTYSVSSRFAMMRQAGTFSINTFTKNETIRKTIDAAFEVTRDLVEQGPSEEEVTKAKRYLTGQFPLGLQAPDDLAAQLVAVQFYGLPPDYLESFADRVNAVTTADVTRALREHVRVADLQVLVVSNADVAKKALTGLGKIQVQAVR